MSSSTSSNTALQFSQFIVSHMTKQTTQTITRFHVIDQKFRFAHDNELKTSYCKKILDKFIVLAKTRKQSVYWNHL